VEHPVIVVPEGVRVPVVAKAELKGAKGKPLIRVGDVYFRTLGSNGTVSTAPARSSDWRDIVEICFENREADIGRFMCRRKRKLGAEQMNKLDAGTWEVALVIDPPRSDATPDKQFLNSFVVLNPNYSGWPVWGRTLTVVEFLDVLAQLIARDRQSDTHRSFSRVWGSVRSDLG